MKGKQKGFAHLGFIILFLLICLVVCGVFFYVKNHDGSSSRGSGQACKAKDGMRICLSSSKTHLSSSETAELKTTISNTTNSNVTKTFNCTFTDPSIILNDDNLNLGIACGQAITDKTIKAHSSESFTYKVSGSQMKAGPNKVKANWSSFGSGEITIRKNAATNSEISDQFGKCQSLKDDIDFDDIPGYCVSINIVLENSDSGQYGCTDWKALFKKVGLSLPCTSVMDIGVGYVYVPRDDAGKYLEKVKSLPEVSSAHVDSGQKAVVN